MSNLFSKKKIKNRNKLFIYMNLLNQEFETKNQQSIKNITIYQEMINL